MRIYGTRWLDIVKKGDEGSVLDVVEWARANGSHKPTPHKALETLL